MENLNNLTQTKLWYSIKDYNNYIISSNGEIINITTKKELKHETVPAGYKRVTLCKNGKTKRFTIHRLLAETFIENKNNKKLVHHIDGSRDNNDLSNLMWVTTKEHHTLHNGFSNKLMKINERNKLKVDMLNMQGQYIKTFDYIGKAAEYLLIKNNKEVNRNNKKNTVGMIVAVCKMKPKKKSYKGYIWRYH